MKTPVSHSTSSCTRNFLRRHARYGFLVCAIASLMFTAGCEMPPTYPQGGAQRGANKEKTEALTLREGDVIKISIPGASNLDSVQTIRRDGKIDLALIGEVQASGLKPSELQAELVRLYGPQLVSKEILVSVVTSNFVTFVSGAVLRPGKITTERAITVLEAIMEAGGPDYAKANLKAVDIIRQDENGRIQKFTVNVKSMMDGDQKEPFFLKPSDMVIVKERFAVF